jgi:hypothetical protein
VIVAALLPVAAAPILAGAFSGKRGTQVHISGALAS